MGAGDVRSLFQISQRARDFHHAVSSTQAHVQAFASGFQPVLVFTVELAVLLHAFEVQMGVGAALAADLLLPGLSNQRGDYARALAGFAVA